jgi:hypothetical protein
MLKRGQIIRAPKDADLVMLREMKKQGLGNVLGVPGGAEFVILQALVERVGIEQGDYMAVRPGWTTFYLIPKATAEGWDLEVDPAQEDERRTLAALRAELDKARSDLEETRLDLKVESGAESGAPHPDWRCSNGRLRLYHRYYGGDLHAVVNADGDWMLYRAGANMLEVKEEIASGPPQLKRSAMIAADTTATQVQEKP